MSKRPESSAAQGHELRVGQRWFLFETSDGARAQVEGQRVTVSESGYAIDGEPRGDLCLVEVRDD